MSGAVAFVMTIATIFTYLVMKLVLEPFGHYSFCKRSVIF